MAVNLENLAVAQLLNNSRPLMEDEDSLQTSHQPANGPYHAQYRLSPQLTCFGPQPKHVATLVKQNNLLY